MRTYAYLRASTAEQDAARASQSLNTFAEEHRLTIAANFIENVSGASLQRPELFRLLAVAQAGDILLVGVSLDIENYCTVSLFFEQTYL